MKKISPHIHNKHQTLPRIPNIQDFTLTKNPLTVKIRHSAFRADMNKIFYFNAAHHSPSVATCNAFTASIKDGILNKGIIFTKCVDTTTNTIIAGARWTLYKPSSATAALRSPGDLDDEYTTPEMYAESHSEVWNTFFDLFHDVKRDVMGLRPFWKLDTLVTDPEHHRRGAGKLLLEEGLRRVDKDGMEAYLESSQMGKGLYKRFGFEVVREISLDLRRWGGDEEICWTVSIFFSSSSSSSSCFRY